MIWQDVVLFIGQWFFALALIPALRAKSKPPLATSIPTGSILLVFAGTYASLGLWSGAVAASVVGVLWLVLAVQKGREG